MNKVFFHISCINQTVFPIVETLVNGIHFSGMYDICESINVGMSGTPELTSLK